MDRCNRSRLLKIICCDQGACFISATTCRSNRVCSGTQQWFRFYDEVVNLSSPTILYDAIHISAPILLTALRSATVRANTCIVDEAARTWLKGRAVLMRSPLGLPSSAWQTIPVRSRDEKRALRTRCKACFIRLSVSAAAYPRPFQMDSEFTTTNKLSNLFCQTCLALPCLALHHIIISFVWTRAALPCLGSQPDNIRARAPRHSPASLSYPVPAPAPARSGEEMTRNSCRPHSGLEKSGGNSRRTGSGRAEWLLRSEERVFLIFILFIFWFFKNIYCKIFFLQIWPPVASSTGGKAIPPDEPAIGITSLQYPNRRFIRRNVFWPGQFTFKKS